MCDGMYSSVTNVSVYHTLAELCTVEENPDDEVRSCVKKTSLRNEQLSTVG